MIAKYSRYLKVIIIIIFLLSLQPIINSTAEGSDVLDQSQTDFTYDNANINNNERWAQSFIPAVALLSRVKLYMNNYGSNDQIKVSIRKNLDDPDLTSITVPSSSIENGEKQWIEFNFSDISVLPGETYYIICDHNSRNSIQWAASFNNLYLRGKAFSQEINPLSEWNPWEDDMPFPYSVDLCFKTYGKYHPPAQPQEPNGPNQLRINQIGQYTTSTDDLDGDLIRYGWDWNDDDNVDYWTDYYEPGETCTVNHSFSEKGDFLIKVIAEDIDGYQSKWSFSKSLAVPHSKNIFFYLVQ